MKKSISLIIPVYNAARYVKDCLESITEQWNESVEVICVDDGSTDNTWEVLCDYAAGKNNIHVLQQENSGPSIARNLGLEHAKNDYVWFVDSDDMLTPDAISTIEKELVKEYDVLIFNHSLVNSQKKQIQAKAAHYEEKECNSAADLYVDQTVPSYPWNKIFRRNFLLQNNLKFECFLPDDEDFLFRTYPVSKVSKIIDKSLYIQRTVDGSLSRSSSSYKKYAVGYIEMMRKYKDYTKKYPNDAYWQKVTLSNIKNFFLNVYRAGLGYSLLKDFRKALFDTTDSFLTYSVRSWLIKIIRNNVKISYMFFSIVAKLKRA